MAGIKLRIEITDEGSENEVIIRCSSIDENVRKLQAFVKSLSAPKLTFYKDAQEYYLPLEEVLFFETDNEQIFAHTKKDSYLVKYKLYELEKLLPQVFVRISKGSIVNTMRVYSINRNLTSSSQICFGATEKQVYVSRHYFKSLKDKMKERGL
ncbi:MAG: LytTR family transcriptional regulator [Oscillospiraceae bacterium]|nr:LytTR family transcriptional regulator [Oscillospiraceae bacterium]